MASQLLSAGIMDALLPLTVLVTIPLGREGLGHQVTEKHRGALALSRPGCATEGVWVPKDEKAFLSASSITGCRRGVHWPADWLPPGPAHPSFLPRLQCGRCQWGWSSAHVHVLFHLWWDADRRLGLVKMRLWGQRCRLCPPGRRGVCQVSLLNVRLFLGKLVQFIVQKCYGEDLSPDQCPEICFGERCEACDLGVCFFQKPLDPAWGPEIPSTLRGGSSGGGGGGGSGAAASSRQALTLVVDRSGGCTPSSYLIPLSMADFVKDLLLESRNLFSEDEDIVTIPFSLARKKKGSLPKADPGSVARGTIYLPGSSKGRSLAVDLRAPAFPTKGLQLSSIKAITGFICKGRGCVCDPEQVPSQGLVTDGNSPRPMTYIIGLTHAGEGCITFPTALADAVLESADPPGSMDGWLTFPFFFADRSRAPTPGAARGNRLEGSGGPAPAGPGPLPGTTAGRLVPISNGSITIPFSILGLIQCKGSCDKASGPQSSDPKPGQPWFWASRSGFPSEEDFGEEGCGVPLFDPYEEVWILVSVAVFILWIMYLYKFSPDHAPRM